MGADGKAWAKAEVEAYMDWCKGEDAKAVRRMDWDADEEGRGGLLNWWRREGRRKFPYMFRVFQSLLSVGAGAAALERDFSIAGNIVRPHRSMLDAALVEISLFLHVNESLIPRASKIKALGKSEVEAKALPPRLRLKKDFKRFLVLDEQQQTVYEQAQPRGC